MTDVICVRGFDLLKFYFFVSHNADSFSPPPLRHWLRSPASRPQDTMLCCCGLLGQDGHECAGQKRA
jgi:hypothetical protein